MSPTHAAARVLAGTAVTDLAFRVSQVALPLVVLAGTGSASATGLVAGAVGVPVLLSPWWARRLRQLVRTGRAVAWCYVGEAAALGTLALAAAAGALDPAVLVVLGLALGCAEALTGPGRDGLLADLGDASQSREGDHRPRGDRALVLLNLRELLRRAGMVAGPVLGGLAVAAGHGLALLVVEVGAVLLAALLVAPVPAPAEPPGGSPSSTSPAIRTVVRARPEVLAGWLVRGNGCLWWFVFSLGLAVLGVEQGRPGVVAATGLSAYGAASLLGTLVAVRVVRRLPVLAAVAGAWVLTGLCWTAVGLAPRLDVVVVASAVAGIVVSVGNAGVTASITRCSAGVERRTLLAGQSVVVNATSSLGLLAGGPVIALLGAGPTLVLGGVATSLGAGLVALRARRPRSRTVPASLVLTCDDADR